MTVTAMDIRYNERAGQRSLGLDRATRDALATYCRETWPSNTAKMAAREWDLSLDEARGIVAGRASQATIDKILKHDNGGWVVALPVLGAVIGCGVETFFRDQIRKAAKAQQDAMEHERAARTAYRRLGGFSDRSGPDGNGSAPAREAGHGAGEVGAAEARRLAD